VFEKAQDLQLVGLDVEWVDNGKVALMQLALPDGSCILIRLHLMNTIPAELQYLLEQTDILKLGVGIKQDCDKLFKDYGIICNSWVDIRYIVQSRRINLRSLGMGSIAKSTLNIDLDKDWRIRASNWEDGDCGGRYSQRQIEYAANDAFIAVSVILSLTIEDLESITKI
jgi:ribonuclease D